MVAINMDMPKSCSECGLKRVCFSDMNAPEDRRYYHCPLMEMKCGTWICTPKKPERKEKEEVFPCLMTVIGDNGTTVVSGLFWFYNQHFSYGADINWISDEKVLAWMPYPEPCPM